MIFSDTLRSLIELSKSLAGESGTKHNIEYFVLASLECIVDPNKLANANGIAELEVLVDKLNENKVSIADAWSRLTESLANTQKELLSTISDFNTVLLSSINEAGNNGSALLTASSVLRKILASPGWVLAEALNYPAPVFKNLTGTEDDIFDEVFGTDGLDKYGFIYPDPEEIDCRVSDLVEKYTAIRDELLLKVKGQDNAVSVLVRGLFQSELGNIVNPCREKPLATFLFAGPPGVGKTMLAEEIAGMLGKEFRRFDMSGFSHREAVIPLCGSDPAYRKSQSGLLTGYVMKNPGCVLLFDEIEKAHINAMNIFLQILDYGKLHDTYLRKDADFSDTIIFFTTNAGKQLYNEWESGNYSSIPRKVILKALEKDTDPEANVPCFPSALISRFASGNVVMFNRLDAHTLISIARNNIQKQCEDIEEELSIKIDVDERVYTALLLAEGAGADARMINGKAQSFLGGELFELFRLAEHRDNVWNADDIREISLKVQLPENDEKISGLFEINGAARMLVFAPEDTVSLLDESGSSCSLFGFSSAIKAMRFVDENDIDAVLIAMNPSNRSNEGVFINLEDIESEERRFLNALREQYPEIPVYILTNDDAQINREESFSFISRGVRGFISLADGAEAIGEELCDISTRVYRQKMINELGKNNRVVSFETGQKISSDGSRAEICLFDFKLSYAVEAEDQKSIVSEVSTPTEIFDDVIGAQGAKDELAYFISYMKNPRKKQPFNARAPKGVILYGPPGTGKTMLARAMAHEAGVTFIAAEGNQFLKKLVGEGPESVHALFALARKYAPSILFIDEIDAIAKPRDDMESYHSEDILTALLNEMDGFRANAKRPVFVLAATNFDLSNESRANLDPALLRRFDRRILVDLPNKENRIRFLREQTAKRPGFDISEAMTENIAVRSTGMSLSELASVLEQAVRSAVRSGRESISDKVLEEAFETYNSGEIKKWNKDELKRTALHEAGHAYVCWKSGEKPNYLTVVARGSHGGYMQNVTEEKTVFTKTELLGRIRTALGGRAAEQVFYGPEAGLSTGAGSDILKATELAREMVCTYGMSEEFGLAALTQQQAMEEKVTAKINALLSAELKNAVELVRGGKAAVEELALALEKENSLNGSEIDDLLRQLENPD